MLVHSVYFYVAPESTPEQREALRKGLETLKSITCVEAIYIGAPAPVAPRPVINRDYAFGLTVICKDLAAHDAYQVDPTHKAFVDACKHLWTKVVIFDTQ
jgi:hypothetical protein